MTEVVRILVRQVTRPLAMAYVSSVVIFFRKISGMKLQLSHLPYVFRGDDDFFGTSTLP